MCSRIEIIEMARKLFDDYDMDCSGSLSRSEVRVIFDTLFTEVAKTRKIDTTRFNKLFTISDQNSDNKLNFKEFIKIVEDFIQPEPIVPTQ